MNRREFVAALLAGPLLQVRNISGQADDLTALTIAEASQRLADKTITPLQLTDAYLRRITQQNKTLNAYVTVTADLSRREASAASGKSGPLAGIPIAHKDLLETRGVRTTAGSMIFDQHIPEHDAAIVERLQRAGAVLLGKTNTHELGGGVTTINPFYGTTRNPVDQTRIAGGSSGGSAAAVVAQLCAGATGSDTGGSVRIPAAFCGCVGFKPTFGRISTQGLIGSSPTFDHIGFLTRTVADAEIMFRAAVGGSATGTLPSPIRIGVPTTGHFFDGIERGVQASFTTAMTRAGDRGARIVGVAPPIDDATMARVFDPIVVFEIWGRLGADWRTNPGSFSKEFSGFFSTPRPPIAEYESALASLKEYQTSFDTLFDTVDVIATPTVVVTAPPIDSRIDGMRILQNTWPINAAGAPAISIPLRNQPIPIGLQLIARRGEDDKLLQIARTFSP